MIQILHGDQGTHQGLGSAYSREEHAMKERESRRGDKRTPRRSYTHNFDIPSPFLTIMPTIYLQATTPLNSPDKERAYFDVPINPPQQERAAVRRPPLPPPRRSYSVMDCEPVPHHHRVSAHMNLLDLPVELHFAIFDCLDLIDSTCLGLVNRHLYGIHRQLHGRVPLSTRRDGPNHLEWAWHQAGSLIKDSPLGISVSTSLAVGNQRTELSELRIRGQAYCRKCGILRCELHKHLEEWMGEEREYCSVKQKFGPVASEGAKPYCYMSKPGDSNRCGRHRVVFGHRVILKP